MIHDKIVTLKLYFFISFRYVTKNTFFASVASFVTIAIISPARPRVSGAQPELANEKNSTFKLKSRATAS